MKKTGIFLACIILFSGISYAFPLIQPAPAQAATNQPAKATNKQGAKPAAKKTNKKAVKKVPPRKTIPTTTTNPQK